MIHTLLFIIFFCLFSNTVCFTFLLFVYFGDMLCISHTYIMKLTSFYFFFYMLYNVHWFKLSLYKSIFNLNTFLTICFLLAPMESHLVLIVLVWYDILFICYLFLILFLLYQCECCWGCYPQPIVFYSVNSVTIAIH